MKPTVKEMIRKTPLFLRASEETAEKLAACRCAVFSKGDVISSPASFFSGLGLILSGRVAVYGKGREGDVLLNTLEAGGVFGAVSLFGEKPESVSTITAARDSEILLIPKAVAEEIVRNDGDVALAYVTFLTDRIRFLNEKIIGFSAPTAERAVCHALREKTETLGLSFPLNVTRLAQSLAIGRMSVYRVIRTLTEEKIVLCERGRMTVANPEKLKEKENLS